MALTSWWGWRALQRGLGRAVSYSFWTTNVTCGNLRPEISSFMIHSTNIDCIIAQPLCVRLSVRAGPARRTAWQNATAPEVQVLAPSLSQARGWRRDFTSPHGHCWMSTGWLFLTQPHPGIPHLVFYKDLGSGAGSPGFPSQLCHRLRASPHPRTV